MKVTGVSSNRLLANAEGTVAQVEKAFGVSIVRYQLGNRLVFAPDQDPSIPATLAATVLGIGGLDDATVAHPYLTVKGSNAQASTGSGMTGVHLHRSPIRLLSAVSLQRTCARRTMSVH